MDHRTYNKKHSSPESGVTLIETVVVMGILVLVAIASLGSMRNVRSKAALDDGQALLVRALEKARSRAATGFGTTNHGVYIEPDRIVEFEGSAYVPGSGTESLLPGAVSIQTSTTVIFTRLTAEASVSATLTLANTSGATSTVIVTGDGAIQPN